MCSWRFPLNYTVLPHLLYPIQPRSYLWMETTILMCFLKQKIRNVYRKTPVSEFFQKDMVLQAAILFKYRFWQKCFPVNFSKFFRTVIFNNASGWIFLNGGKIDANIFGATLLCFRFPKCFQNLIKHQSFSFLRK